MADSTPRKYDIGPPKKDPLKRSKSQQKYFFMNGKLYESLRQDRSRDILMAKCHSDKKIVSLLLSDSKRVMRPAYDTREVAHFLNRTTRSISQYITDKVINEPIRIHASGVNAYGHPFARMKWSEADIIALHEYLLTNGGGRPRKDGTMYSAARLPTRKELLAMMRQQPMFYMKTADGEMTPVWSAYNEV